MQGLIFVTWEKYLSERFGSSLLHEYRAAIGETPANSPLASRVYDDETLLAGVGVACKLTRLPANTILREYGRYFMLNGLTSYLCSYLLARVHSGRDLLLTMRKAHAQMHCASDALMPPVFGYEALSSDPKAFALIYGSPRQLCPVLLGAIEGAAERYGETVHIAERTCMRQGMSVCRFEVRFFSSPSSSMQQMETPEQIARRQAQQQLADLALAVLPHSDGVTLAQLQKQLHYVSIGRQPLRPKMLLDALHRLQHAGLVASTASQPGDDLTHRRYWRAPTSGEG